MVKVSKKLFSKISDIVIPDYINNPYQLSNTVLNSIYSQIGGILPTQAIFLTGQPGTGKTTLAAYTGSQVSNYVKSTNIKCGRNFGPVVFISREMSDFQMKLLERNIGDLSDIYLIRDTVEGKYIDWLYDISQLKPSLLIVDSVQKLADEIGGQRNKVQIEIVKTFKSFAKITTTPLILIGHMGKSGQYIGPSFVQHEVDTHIQLKHNKVDDCIMITQEKNRYNDISKKLVMRFDEYGLDFDYDLL